MSSDFGAKCRNVWPRKYSSKRYGKRSIMSQDFNPGFMNLDGCYRPEPSHAWQYNGHSMNQQAVNRFPQPFYANFPHPHLKSFDELQTERSYLINSLQREDFKATELLKKIRNLQESVPDIIEGPVHRKSKKQLGYLKNRMCQCTKQEKTILARLGHVTYEIQSKERWSRVENERLQQWNCHDFEQMRLDATCAEFTPQGVYPHQLPVEPMYNSGCYGGNSYPMPKYEPVPEWHAPTIHREAATFHELPCVVTSPTSNRVRSTSVVSLTAPTEKVKRLSMPELSVVEAKGEASNDDDDRYVGYYISKAAN